MRWCVDEGADSPHPAHHTVGVADQRPHHPVLHKVSDTQCVATRRSQPDASEIVAIEVERGLVEVITPGQGARQLVSGETLRIAASITHQPRTREQVRAQVTRPDRADGYLAVVVEWMRDPLLRGVRHLFAHTSSPK